MMIKEVIGGLVFLLGHCIEILKRGRTGDGYRREERGRENSECFNFQKIML